MTNPSVLSPRVRNICSQQSRMVVISNIIVQKSPIPILQRPNKVGSGLPFISNAWLTERGRKAEKKQKSRRDLKRFFFINTWKDWKWLWDILEEGFFASILKLLLTMLKSPCYSFFYDMIANHIALSITSPLFVRFHHYFQSRHFVSCFKLTLTIFLNPVVKYSLNRVVSQSSGASSLALILWSNCSYYELRTCLAWFCSALLLNFTLELLCYADRAIYKSFWLASCFSSKTGSFEL